MTREAWTTATIDWTDVMRVGAGAHDPVNRRRVSSPSCFSRCTTNKAVKHQAIMDMFKTTRGRTYDPARNLAANIGKLVVELSGSQHVTKKALDGFVTKAMTWLLTWLSQRTAADATISKSRRRRAQRRRLRDPRTADRNVLADLKAEGHRSEHVSTSSYKKTFIFRILPDAAPSSSFATAVIESGSPAMIYWSV